MKVNKSSWHYKLRQHLLHSDPPPISWFTKSATYSVVEGKSACSYFLPIITAPIWYPLIICFFILVAPLIAIGWLITWPFRKIEGKLFNIKPSCPFGKIELDE